MSLAVRMYLVLGLLFAIVYALITVIGTLLGLGNLIFFVGIAIVMMVVQYLIGPRMVEWGMRVRYVSAEEEPELHRVIGELAQQAGIPKPKIGIAPTPVPNAFAFGRSRASSSICVTEGIRQLLSKKELEAVLGHEVSHIVNRDVAVITMVSVIPTLAWYLAWSSMFSHGDNRGSAALIGIVAFIIYFITNLLVLYVSRLREYYADRGSVHLGQKPHDLASALYKLVYGTARLPRETVKKTEGMKAFFASDPSRAAEEFTDLKAVDADLSGTIETHELAELRKRRVKLSGSDRLLEVLSTHPNMLKRIQRLSHYQES